MIHGVAAQLSWRDFREALTVSGQPGSFAIAGQNADLIFRERLIAAAGSYALAGQAAGFKFADFELLSAFGALTTAGQAASLQRSASTETAGSLSGDYNTSANELSLQPLTTPSGSAFVVSSLTVKIGTAKSAGNKVKGVVYTRTGTTAGALVATSAEYSVTGSEATSADIVLSFSSPPSLSGATEYFFGLHYDSGSTDFRRTTTAPLLYFRNQTYSSGPPSSVTTMTAATVSALYVRADGYVAQ